MRITLTLKLFFVGLVLFWSILLSLVAISGLPYNPLSMSLRIELGIRSVLPEGWGFFTKDPRVWISTFIEKATAAGNHSGRCPSLRRETPLV